MTGRPSIAEMLAASANALAQVRAQTTMAVARFARSRGPPHTPPPRSAGSRRAGEDQEGHQGCAAAAAKFRPRPPRRAAARPPHPHPRLPLCLSARADHEVVEVNGFTLKRRKTTLGGAPAQNRIPNGAPPPPVPAFKTDRKSVV